MPQQSIISSIAGVGPKTDANQRQAYLRITNKNVAVFWLILLTQLFYCLMYGIFIVNNQTKITQSEYFVHTALLFLLIIGGFGLILCSAHQMVWTSLGFNLIITALAVQTYFLAHIFWTKVAIYWTGQNFDTASVSSSWYYSKIYLTADQVSTLNHATLSQAIKCSLSCIVAFSFIAGRAGLLQLYFLTIFGSLIYQLTRQICLNVFPYDIGTIKIFVFGSFLGLVVSCLIRKLGRQANTIDHFNNYTNRNTIIMSLVGTLIIWALFPLLTRETNITENVTTTWSRVFSCVLAMSSAGLLAIFIGSQKYGFRMVSYSILGAGVATLSSTAYISNPVYAIVFGLSSAIAQLVFMGTNSILRQKIGPMDPHAYVFIGQSFLGIFYQTINRQIVQNNPNSLVFDWLKSKRPEYILGTGAITIGIAITLGFLIGTLFACCAYHDQIDHYTDYTYWEKGDGISNVQQSVVKVVVQEKTKDIQMFVSEHHSDIKQRNAYL